MAVKDVGESGAISESNYLDY